jgi:hypothetical protein
VIPLLVAVTAILAACVVLWAGWGFGQFLAGWEFTHSTDQHTHVKGDRTPCGCSVNRAPSGDITAALHAELYRRADRVHRMVSRVTGG